jgi:predicted TPR repeat methyltransferase
MIDLGCGTGLSGLVFKSMAKRLTGVDLSSKMIALAERRGIYTVLETNGLEEFLEHSVDTFDLAVAADVFVYIGDLAPVYETLYKRLAPGAYFVFSTESSHTESWELLTTGRYAHSPSYIRSLANIVGFSVLLEKAARIRKEKEQWIMGDLYIMRKEVSS